MTTPKKPYPVFKDGGILTDDTPCMTSVFPGMTCKKWDDMMLANFVKNLERGNEIIRRLQEEKHAASKGAGKPESE